MSYTTVTIYYLSGTGNSYKTAQWMLRQARKAGAKACLRPLAAAAPEREVPDTDRALLALVLPTHGFTAPWTLIRFVLGLPRRSRTRVVTVVTRAGWRLFVNGRGLSGTANAALALLLAIKGYRVRGALGVDMPSNWIAAHPGLAARDVRRIVDAAQPRVEAFLAKILSGRSHRLTLDNVGEFLCGLALLPVSLGYLLFGRFLLAKIFFASHRCNGCGVCAEHCPVRAVVLRGQPPRPYWRLRCESCMRCMNYCPSRAIEAGHSLLVLLIWITHFSVAAWALHWLAVRWAGPARLDHPVVRFALDYVYFLGALVLTRALLEPLLRFRWINAVFTHTTFTPWFRRYHEPSVGLKQLQAIGDEAEGFPPPSPHSLPATEGNRVP